jgi:transposase
MRAYSMDLRQRVVRAMDEGPQTQVAVAQRFGVSTRWIRTLLRRRQQTGSIAPKPHAGGQPRKLDGEALDQLRQQLQDHPDATLQELRQACGVLGSLMCVWRALRRLKVTLKKKVLRAKEQLDPQVQAQRQAWRQQAAAVDPQRFFFVDESHARTDLTRAYGRAGRGQRVVDYVSQRHWQATTMRSVLGYEGTTATMTYEGGTDLEVMLTYVEHQLTPLLKPGDIVALDRLAAHPSPKVVSAIEATGAAVWLLPPYSPDFNPIELMWAKIKAYLRKVLRTAEGASRPLWQWIGDALRTITKEDAVGWFGHCGYRITQT